MTTLVGIKANEGREGVVIASDYQVSEEDGRGYLISKSPRSKIDAGPFWAMAHAGGDALPVREFYKFLKGNKGNNPNKKKARSTILSAIDDLHFPEVVELNTKLSAKGNEEDAVSFLLAINDPELNLYLVDSYGNIKGPNDESDFDYICLGSGGEKAENYIKDLLAQEKIDRDEISLKEAIYVARGAIGAAETEAGTGMGFNLVVLVKGEIGEYGKEMRSELRKTEEASLEKIVKHYVETS